MALVAHFLYWSSYGWVYAFYFDCSAHVRLLGTMAAFCPALLLYSGMKWSFSMVYLILFSALHLHPLHHHSFPELPDCRGFPGSSDGFPILSLWTFAASVEICFLADICIYLPPSILSASLHVQQFNILQTNTNRQKTSSCLLFPCIYLFNPNGLMSLFYRDCIFVLSTEVYVEFFRWVLISPFFQPSPALCAVLGDGLFSLSPPPIDSTD